MAAKLDQRGWTAAEQLAPCVICYQPAILRSPRNKPKAGYVGWFMSG
jgi:hypothetical protein